MSKKLMLLSCLVALLGLSNIAFANSFVFKADFSCPGRPETKKGGGWVDLEVAGGCDGEGHDFRGWSNVGGTKIDVLAGNWGGGGNVFARTGDPICNTTYTQGENGGGDGIIRLVLNDLEPDTLYTMYTYHAWDEGGINDTNSLTIHGADSWKILNDPCVDNTTYDNILLASPAVGEMQFTTDASGSEVQIRFNGQVKFNAFELYSGSARKNRFTIEDGNGNVAAKNRNRQAPRIPNKPKAPWPGLRQVRKIEYLSSGDNTMQPALFYAPDTDKAVPLLVGLHSWSGNYRQGLSKPYANWCIKKGWVFIHPHFRGGNNKPEACGSDLVIADILTAVEYAKQNADVDPNRIYLVGGSGGGYTALQVAGRAPDVWAGVSAWLAPTVLEDWYYQNKLLGCEQHASDIVKSCGGLPGQSPEIDAQYAMRSPVTHLKNAVNLPLDINAGIHDGHDSGGVPVSHSFKAFNAVAEPNDRVSDDDIRYFHDNSEVPPHLKQTIIDPTYGQSKALFRRVSGNTRLTIFDGGHRLNFHAALT